MAAAAAATAAAGARELTPWPRLCGKQLGSGCGRRERRQPETEGAAVVVAAAAAGGGLLGMEGARVTRM